VVQKRLKTAAAREEYARQQIREQLLSLVASDDARGLEELLQRLLVEACSEEGGRPRGHAQTRDDRGNTLLAVAAMNNAGKVAKCVRGGVDGAAGSIPTEFGELINLNVLFSQQKQMERLWLYIALLGCLIAAGACAFTHLCAFTRVHSNWRPVLV
jgi:hypothetical protein